MLPTVDGPQDLEGLSMEQLEQLCGEVRDYIIRTVGRTGGHLAPSLGVVELTVALHRVFRSPGDKIVWDVGHQSYTHKILTGRREAFRTLRQRHGLSGFCRRAESPHDPFGTGHASTSISAAFGIAAARDLRGDDERVVAVIGDGALSGGLAFEGLDNAGGCSRDLIVILNDNNMSISPTVGALSRHLTDIITHPLFEQIKRDVWEITERLPRVTGTVRQIVQRMEESLKGLLTPGLFFESLGFRYLGPVPGHHLPRLIGLLEKVRAMRGPILVHVITQKGKGLPDAEKNPRKFHGIAPLQTENGKMEPARSGLTYTKVFGETLCELAAEHSDLVAITAAMPDGTGLSRFASDYPDRFFDVGIAEAHAVTFAGGMAARGARPVVAVYSTFLQRAFDSLVHDVGLQRLPVIFALDRAGLVGEDGATHHGMFDLSYLGCIPGITIAAPRNGAELRDLLYTAVHARRGPFALRYPRATVPDPDALEQPPRLLEIGRWEQLKPGGDGCFLAVGPLVGVALAAAEHLHRDGLEFGVVNARFVKPLDEAILLRLASEQPLLVTLEEGTVAGGFGTQVALALTRRDGAAGARLLQLGLPDCYIEHGAREELLAAAGLSPQGVAEQVRARLRRRAPEAAHPAAGDRRWSASRRPGEPAVGG
ncbi:MAG: 1-deoxy-D-xylulose-5-phosphate synthase [Candidatus Eisenbacteria sp.]|nr:1-deoxy-D-xylulose-5-phosphate synthase [Candidatus Eisenbacteria bacterium]